MVSLGDEVYRSLFDPLPQPVLLLRGQDIAYANRAASRLIGTRTLVGEPLKRFVDCGASAATCRVHRTDGSAVEVEVRRDPLFVGDEQLTRVELTAPVQPDPSVQAAPAQGDATFQPLPEYQFLLDASARILEFHAPPGAMPVLPSLDLVGRSLKGMFPAAIGERLQAAAKEALRTGRAIGLQCEQPLLGLIRCFEVRMVPVRDDRVLAIVRDVFDSRRAAERQLEADKLRSIERLAGGIAHDFNNLLTAVVAHAELLKLDDDESTPLEHADAILVAAERGADLTRKLLAFSGDHLGDPEMLDLRDLVRAAEARARGHSTDDVKIRALAGAMRLPVLADRGHLERALFHLVDNALEAMAHGGELVLACRRVRVGPVGAARHVGLEPGEYALVVVKDDGEGMDDDTRVRAFEPFFTTRPQRQGLGLPTASGVVKQLGGFLAALSKPGRGSAFFMFLPLVARGLERVDSPQAPAAGGRTVLLVEDDAIVRIVTARLLENLGHRVLQAGDGLEALNRIESERLEFDVLVTDVVMPHLDGPELVKRVRADRPELPVLFVSGFTSSELEPDDLRRSGTAFLQKPYSPADLRRSVRELLAQR